MSVEAIDIDLTNPETAKAATTIQVFPYFPNHMTASFHQSVSKNQKL
jgi:hypothetical protein